MKIPLPERLLAARGKRSRADLASVLGINAQTLYRYEKGNIVPSADVLAAIASELKVSADWLLGLIDDPKGVPSGPVITAPNNRGTIAQHSPGMKVTADCENCAKLMKLQAQLDILKEVMKK